MKIFRIITYVVLAVLVIVFTAVHGNIVDLDAAVKLQYSQIQVNLQRHVDLLPNYLETVKAQMEHDEVIVSMVTEARALGSKAISSTRNCNVTKAQEAIANYDIDMDNYLNFITEKYPELSSDQDFQDLQDELADTKNRISISYQYYNSAVDRYNRYIDNFPGVLIASIIKAEHAEPFSAIQSSEIAPTISFD